MKLAVIMLSCIALTIGCGDKSNTAGPGPVNYARLVDKLIHGALSKTGDTCVLKITLYTSSGAPDTQISNYTSADVYTTNAIHSYHFVSLTMDANNVWTAGAVQISAKPAGIQMTGVGSPALDFKDALRIILDSNLVLTGSDIELDAPLASRALDTALYQALCLGATGINVVSVNSISGKVTIQ
jgi:hypothetical protein